MRRRSRLLRVAKWGGVVVCVAVLVSFGISIWPGAFYNAGTWGLGVRNGRVDCVWGDDASPFSNPVGFGIRGGGVFSLWDARPIGWPDGPTLTWVSFPLWMPLIAFAIPTGLFFYLDRRPLPGHCPCGYDLTGNVSGRCPECGVETG